MPVLRISATLLSLHRAGHGGRHGFHGTRIDRLGHDAVLAQLLIGDERGQRLGGGQTEIVRRIALAACGDVLRRTGAAHLPGVQRRAAGAVDAVACCGLADREQSLDVRLPPAVNAGAAVVVLGA